jgi:indoleamine 2,3-dioxygenase
MNQSYQITLNRGFLPNPDPLIHLADVTSGLTDSAVSELEEIAAEMPMLLPDSPLKLRHLLDEMPVFDVSAVQENAAFERLFMLYTYFANAYVYAIPNEPSQRVPASVAVPLTRIATTLERPPILSYAALVLNNWRRLDPRKNIVLENLEHLVAFQNLPDEHWFMLVHVNVEAAATDALLAILDGIAAAENADLAELELALGQIADGIQAMLKVFGRMTAGCDPDIYHRQVRVFRFGLTGVLFEGVSQEPQTLNGGSGAQSSTIPAFVGALGIQHEKTGLMKHLDNMQLYMPKLHRQFITDVSTPIIRNTVMAHPENTPLRDAYNHCIQQLLIFRKAHLHYARVYIFDKVANPVGTGGTPFMDWLGQLLRETEAHIIR